MNCLVNLKLYRSATSFAQKISSFSTVVDYKKNATEERSIQDVQRLTKIKHTQVSRKPKKKPFVKNLFLGNFDNSILAFPETLEKELFKNHFNLKSKIDNALFTECNEQESNVTELLQCLKQQDLFGMQVSTVLGGQNYTSSEICSLTETIYKYHKSLDYFYNEHLGIAAIEKCGSEGQRVKYINKLINGNSICAFCISEATIGCSKTNATYSESTGEWIINGQKDWIINGNTADIMIVFANTDLINKMGLKEKKLTAFIVERDFEGIATIPSNIDGLHNSNLCSIKFENTRVPKDNVLGEVNSGETIISNIISVSRLLVGPMCLTLMKNLVKNLIEHSKEIAEAVNVTNQELMQSKIGEIIVPLYAIESMVYLTSGLLDGYEDPDCELESAIVKVFSSEQCLKAVQNIISLLGTPAFTMDHWCNELLHDALSHVLLNETNDNLKIIVGVLGLQYAGFEMREEIKKYRNPLFHPGDVFKRMWLNRKHNIDDPELILNLKYHLHPTLLKASDILEYSVLRLQYAVQILFARYGPEILNKHIDIQRLAKCAIDIYAMTACLSRASRSYCIGLESSEYDINIANTFCFEAVKRVKTNIKDILDSPYGTNDANYLKIAKRAFEKGDYFLAHPLHRNY